MYMLKREASLSKIRLEAGGTSSIPSVSRNVIGHGALRSGKETETPSSCFPTWWIASTTFDGALQYTDVSKRLLMQLPIDRSMLTLANPVKSRGSCVRW